LTLQLDVYGSADREGVNQKHVNKTKVWKLANLLHLSGDIERLKYARDGRACRLRVHGPAARVRAFIEICQIVSVSLLRTRGVSPSRASAVDSHSFCRLSISRRRSTTSSFAVRRIRSSSAATLSWRRYSTRELRRTTSTSGFCVHVRRSSRSGTERRRRAAEVVEMKERAAAIKTRSNSRYIVPYSNRSMARRPVRLN
jgi:hypothetical protein